MKSKIRVEFDFDKNEPYIQLSLDDSSAHNEQADMRDTVLKAFIERANKNGLEVLWPDIPTSPQLRLIKQTTITQFVEPVDWTIKLQKEHVKINATYHQSYGSDVTYENGKPYNLMFSIADNNSIIVDYGGGISLHGDSFRRYNSLLQFLEYWTVNPISK